MPHCRRWLTQRASTALKTLAVVCFCQRISSTGVTPRIPNPAEITTATARGRAIFAAVALLSPSWRNRNSGLSFPLFHKAWKSCFPHKRRRRRGRQLPSFGSMQVSLFHCFRALCIPERPSGGFASAARGIASLAAWRRSAVRTEC